MFNLEGGPPIPSLEAQLNGDFGTPSNLLDIDPFMDKSCSRMASGSYCKGTTAEAVDLFRRVQQAINEAAGALARARLLNVSMLPPAAPIKAEQSGSVGATTSYVRINTDGVIGPSTANLAIGVLKAAPATSRSKVWLEDPRSATVELMAPLLAAQPQYAIDTFEEIRYSALQQAAASEFTPAPASSPTPPPAFTPTPVAVPAARTQPAVSFWTRKRKIVAVAGVGVLAIGLFTLVMWMRKRGT